MASLHGWATALLFVMLTGGACATSPAGGRPQAPVDPASPWAGCRMLPPESGKPLVFACPDVPVAMFLDLPGGTPEAAMHLLAAAVRGAGKERVSTQRFELLLDGQRYPAVKVTGENFSRRAKRVWLMAARSLGENAKTRVVGAWLPGNSPAAREVSLARLKWLLLVGPILPREG